MRTIEELDDGKVIELIGYQYYLDNPAHSTYVKDLEPIFLTPQEAKVFIGWAKSCYYRRALEEDLQSIANDKDGNPLLTTWVPLTTFRNHMCFATSQSPSETKKLLKSLYDRTITWRDKGVEEVVFHFYIKGKTASV
ncbi:hypothetical protein [Vibrio crassostreae]|uniref:hypothetical protein n=1 Tax=Vibrio crassostreae TaxID=246167 RepID=UPI001B30A8F6|nr:hypothetical protein [Vibrio crassostreae]